MSAVKQKGQDVCGLDTHTRLTALFSGTTQMSRYQKGKTNLDFTEARGSEWQWLQLGHVLVCTSLHTDNHASTPPLSFLQAGCLSCHPTNSVKALKAIRLCWLDRALLINHNRSNVSLKTEQADARPLLSTVDVAGIRSIFFWTLLRWILTCRPHRDRTDKFLDTVLSNQSARKASLPIIP